MCLKIFHRFTFSNMEAYMEAVAKIKANKYTYQPISGSVCIINELDYNIFLDNREDLPYSELERIRLNDWFICEYLSIDSWTSYNRVVERVKDVDVFGQFIIEVQ